MKPVLFCVALDMIFLLSRITKIDVELNEDRWPMVDSIHHVKACWLRMNSRSTLDWLNKLDRKSVV